MVVGPLYASKLEAVQRLLESALRHKPYARPVDEQAAAWSAVDADVWTTDPRRWDVMEKFVILMAMPVRHQRLCNGWDERMFALHAQLSKDHAQHTSLVGGKGDNNKDNGADGTEQVEEVEAMVDPTPTAAVAMAATTAVAADGQSKRPKRRVVAPVRFGIRPSATPTLHLARDSAIMRLVVEQRPYVVHRPNGPDELVEWTTLTLKPKCAWELTHDFVHNQIKWLARLLGQPDDPHHAALMAAHELLAMVRHYNDASDADLKHALDRIKADPTAATASSLLTPHSVTFDDILLREVLQRHPPLGQRQLHTWELLASGLNARLGAKVFFSGLSCKARVATLRAVARGTRHDALVELSDAHKAMLSELELYAAKYTGRGSTKAALDDRKPMPAVLPLDVADSTRVAAGESIGSGERITKRLRRTTAMGRHGEGSTQTESDDAAAARAAALPAATPAATPTTQASAHQSVVGAMHHTHEGRRDEQSPRDTTQLSLALVDAIANRDRRIGEELAMLANELTNYRTKCEAADTTLRDVLATLQHRP